MQTRQQASEEAANREAQKKVLSGVKTGADSLMVQAEQRHWEEGQIAFEGQMEGPAEDQEQSKKVQSLVLDHSVGISSLVQDFFQKQAQAVEFALGVPQTQE